MFLLPFVLLAWKLRGAHKCQEWEALLVVVRRVRQRLWDANVKYQIEKQNVGEQWMQSNYGSEYTDGFPLRYEGDEDALHEIVDIFGGYLQNVSIDSLKSYLKKLKRQHFVVFDP